MAATVPRGVANGPVNLRPTPRRSLAILPQVLPNSVVPPDIALRINAALRREDARASQAAAQCRQSYRDMQKRPSADAWTRDVTVTMAGPTYLAYQVSDSSYCGGAYPNDGMRSTFVYDLATGRPVDWLALFPAGASGKNETSVSGATLGLVVWPELARRMADDSTEECREAIGDMPGQGRVTSFTIGLNARSGELWLSRPSFPT